MPPRITMLMDELTNMATCNGTSAFHRTKCEAKIALAFLRQKQRRRTICHVGVAHLAERTLSSRTNLSLVTSLWKRFGNPSYIEFKCDVEETIVSTSSSKHWPPGHCTALKCRREQTNNQLGWTWYVERPKQA